jgi:hypothetical protein
MFRKRKPHILHEDTMPLPPPHDHRIPLPDAAALIRNHRANAADAVARGGMFHAKAVLDLLAQPGCVGLRFYYGRKQSGADALVLVGVDADGNDISSGAVLEEHWPCPPWCTATGILGSSS